MALMFQRLAHNFIKNGYFPTDAETIARILNHLKPSKSGKMRIFDPAAGEGIALAECQNHLGKHNTISYAVEYDSERAWHCKSILDYAVHGDFQNAVIGKQSFGLVFNNPPYGDLVADKAMLSEEEDKIKRLEKLFYIQSFNKIQFGGVMVLIVPVNCIDVQFADWIGTHFKNIKAYLAPEQRFKQVVIFGVRKRVNDSYGFDGIESKSSIKKLILSISEGETTDVLPLHPDDEPYVIPATKSADIKFYYASIDPEQLKDELNRRKASLWSTFEDRYQKVALPSRQPLCKLSDWHLALMLAAGQIETRLLESTDGRKYIVKGDTHKGKTKKVHYEEQANGSHLEVRTLTDKFVPVICGWDMTEGSPTYGNSFIVK